MCDMTSVVVELDRVRRMQAKQLCQLRMLLLEIEECVEAAEWIEVDGIWYEDRERIQSYREDWFEAATSAVELSRMAWPDYPWMWVRPNVAFWAGR